MKKLIVKGLTLYLNDNQVEMLKKIGEDEIRDAQELTSPIWAEEYLIEKNRKVVYDLEKLALVGYDATSDTKSDWTLWLTETGVAAYEALKEEDNLPQIDPKDEFAIFEKLANSNSLFRKALEEEVVNCGLQEKEIPTDLETFIGYLKSNILESPSYGIFSAIFSSGSMFRSIGKYWNQAKDELKQTKKELKEAKKEQEAAQQELEQMKQQNLIQKARLNAYRILIAKHTKSDGILADFLINDEEVDPRLVEYFTQDRFENTPF